MKNIPEPTRKAASEPMRGNCAKRLSILEAAANVFCRQGFSGASIDEIAAEACVSRQTVYNHDREKETLFMAVVADVMDRANAQLYAILSTFPERTDNLENDLVRFSMSLSRNCICNKEGRFLRRLVQASAIHISSSPGASTGRARSTRPSAPSFPAWRTREHWR